MDASKQLNDGTAEQKPFMPGHTSELSDENVNAAVVDDLLTTRLPKETARRMDNN